MNSSSSDPLHGLDPAGLMAAAAIPTDGGADTLPLKRADLPSPEEISAAFPELEVLDLIGHGGMSAVFKARQPKLDRVIALKVLPKSLAATPGFPERFKREGRVLARLSHPNIVAVHDFGESGGFCYLVMEYVDGVNLRQAMRAGRFTPEQALNIIPAICDALQFAHTQGVLHRDIKPENILLDSKGRVKIADFGIAKILGEDGDAMLLTQSGAKLGTAPYMAPEQIEKPASVDHRADIYSLGVVFYEMLTGELPLGRFAAPSEKSAVGGNIDEIVFRALEKERARRQQSADEFKTQVTGAGRAPVAACLGKGWGDFEYKSKRTLFGLPLLHVVHGRDPATGKRRQAHGFFAFGELAKGVFAFGGVARGFFACGGLAVGVVSFGGLGAGLISIGGISVALLLGIGGVAVGTLAMGGVAIGWMASGGVAVGAAAYGGIASGATGMGGVVGAGNVVKHIADLPPLLQRMVALRPCLSSLTMLWLPLSLMMVLVPWWARRQVAAAAGRLRREEAARSLRVFWLLPAVCLAGVVFMLVVSSWGRHSGAGSLKLILPTIISGTGLLMLGLALPLWLRLVPVNPLYGVRLPSTMQSESRWYDVNAVFGRHLFWWSLFVTGAGAAGFYQLPRHFDAYSWGCVAFTLAAAIASMLSTLVWMRRHPEGREPAKPHWLLRNLELVVPVLVLMFFVRSFIARAYVMPSGNEPGVARNSRWIASHLNTGFAPGDLVAYAHENGQTWLAHVTVVESKGLRLKRGGKPEEFFMPWDKIIGRMLFPFRSPGAAPKP